MCDGKPSVYKYALIIGQIYYVIYMHWKKYIKISIKEKVLVGLFTRLIRIESQGLVKIRSGPNLVRGVQIGPIWSPHQALSATVHRGRGWKKGVCTNKL